MNDDPRILVRVFLDNLPATIKSGVVSSIASIYSGQHSVVLNVPQAEIIIAEALKLEHPLAASRAIVFLCATIDHVLTRGLTHSEKGSSLLQKIAQASGDKKLLVVHHSDFDVLIPSHSRIGKFSGGKRISMLRATPGWRRMNPLRSRVTIIWWTDGGLTRKWRWMSASAGDRPNMYE